MSLALVARALRGEGMETAGSECVRPGRIPAPLVAWAVDTVGFGRGSPTFPSRSYGDGAKMAPCAPDWPSWLWIVSRGGIGYILRGDPWRLW